MGRLYMLNHPSHIITGSLLPIVSRPIETVHNPCLFPQSPSCPAPLALTRYNVPSRTPMNVTKPRSCHRIASLTTTTSRTTILKTPFPSPLTCIPHIIFINHSKHNTCCKPIAQEYSSYVLQHHNFFKSTCAIGSLTSRRLNQEWLICGID